MELIGTIEAARLLQLGPDRVRQLADEGKLKAIRTSSGWRLFERADVERLVAQRAEAALATDAKKARR